MAQDTTIEWTQSTCNPVAGCTKVSAGCKHCYGLITGNSVIRRRVLP
jgi:protein gp37